jgi:hypothetical protein
MFPTYRKFFVLLGVLILFVMFFVNYWKMHAIETFAAQTENYPAWYHSGQPVNIDGKFVTGDPNNRYKMDGGPLETIRSTDCNTKCNQQEECNRRNGNTCVSENKDRKCYCRFSQKKANTESFQDIAQTTANFDRIIKNMPNSVKPSWVYPKTKGKMEQIEKDTILLTDLKIDDLNIISVSFLIKSDPATDQRGKIPILSLGSARATYDLVTKNYNTLEINTPLKIVSIGLDSGEKLITLTINNGLYKVYENGTANRNDNSTYLGNVPSASTLKDNDVSLILNKTNADGIYLKDLKTYNHTLTEDEVSLTR